LDCVTYIDLNCVFFLVYFVNGRRGPFVLIVSFTTMIMVINRIIASINSVGKFDLR